MNPMTPPVTYHVLPYVTWRQLGRTDCCGRLVTELPKTDACGSDQRGREPDQRQCTGERPTS